MRRIEFTYEVLSEVEITGAEFLVLEEAAKTHYDYTCKGLAQLGGFLYGWRNQFELFGEVEEVKKPFEERKAAWRLRSRDLDLLCKVCESPTATQKAPHLYFEFCRLFQAAKEELFRLSSPSSTSGA